MTNITRDISGEADFKDLFETSIFEATITDVDYSADTADIASDEFGAFSGVEIFYHCQGATDIAGGSAAFNVGDVVIVENHGGSCEPSVDALTIIGFTDGLHYCGSTLMLLYIYNVEPYAESDVVSDIEDLYRQFSILIWDTAHNAPASIEADGGGVVSFPCQYNEIPDAFWDIYGGFDVRQTITDGWYIHRLPGQTLSSLSSETDTRSAAMPDPAPCMSESSGTAYVIPLEGGGEIVQCEHGSVMDFACGTAPAVFTLSREYSSEGHDHQPGDWPPSHFESVTNESWAWDNPYHPALAVATCGDGLFCVSTSDAGSGSKVTNYMEDFNTDFVYTEETTHTESYNMTEVDKVNGDVFAVFERSYDKSTYSWFQGYPNPSWPDYPYASEYSEEITAYRFVGDGIIRKILGVEAAQIAIFHDWRSPETDGETAGDYAGGVWASSRHCNGNDGLTRDPSDMARSAALEAKIVDLCEHHIARARPEWKMSNGYKLPPQAVGVRHLAPV